ncbi:hypothetical protein BGZ73_008884 [Actinomortierella ambigua]|nr:hypothetical protein BGZ73_008884 [Actinomortierella ambigua]
MLPRAKLHEIMNKLIPEGKILYGRKVTSVQQNDEGALVICGGNEVFHGDVVVGADGAYSSVRSSLYKQLKAKGQLPKEDDTDPPFSTLCLVGVTRPLPPGAVEVEDGRVRFEGVIYQGLPYVSMLSTTVENSVAFTVIQHMGSFVTRDEEKFKNSEWAAEGAEGMMDKVRDLPTAFGFPLGYLFDNTPKDVISKVMLEEKIYKTWHHGQGAVNAMQDAVVLANVLEACPSTNVADIRRCLDAYYDERFQPAKSAYESSHRASRLLKKVTSGSLLAAGPYYWELPPKATEKL